MKQFTLKNPTKMGDKDQKYGQAYWSYTHDSDLPIKFNLMEGEVGDGTIITAEEWVNKQSSKGTEYMQLRKVKAQSQQTIGVTASTKDVKPRNEEGMYRCNALNNATALVANLTHPNADMVLDTADKFYGWLSGEVRTQQSELNKLAGDKFSEDTVVTDIGDEPIRLEDIPFS